MLSFHFDTVKLSTVPIRYGSDTVLYGSDTVLYGSDTVLYGSDTVLYGSDTVRYGSDTVRYGSDRSMSFARERLAMLSLILPTTNRFLIFGDHQARADLTTERNNRDDVYHSHNHHYELAVNHLKSIFLHRTLYLYQPAPRVVNQDQILISRVLLKCFFFLLLK